MNRRPELPAREHYDAVVAGGGPAGAAAALTLARAGRSVLLADAGAGPPKVTESLVPAARVLLHDLGVSPAALDAEHPRCYGNLSAWGSPEAHAVDFLNDPHGHGWHLERPLFDRLLRRAARAAGAEVAEGTSVRRPRRQADGGWRVALGQDAAAHTVRCRWLVDATGRRAAPATHCGARRYRYDRLVAVHLSLPSAESAAEGRSLVESGPDGWWYTAPRPSGERLIAYFTDSDLAPAGGGGREAFVRLLAGTRHIADLADLAEPAERHADGAGALSYRVPPRRVAAHTARLEPAAGPGWIAAGDAALAFDPLSSQGVLTALYTGLSAGEAVDARLRGRDEALDGYERRLAETFTAYLDAHRAVHAQEGRWPDHAFWRRRHAVPDRRPGVTAVRGFPDQPPEQLSGPLSCGGGA